MKILIKFGALLVLAFIFSITACQETNDPLPSDGESGEIPPPTNVIDFSINELESLPIDTVYIYNY